MLPINLHLFEICNENSTVLITSLSPKLLKIIYLNPDYFSPII